MSSKSGGRKKKDDLRIIAQNRKAHHNYELEDPIEAGIILKGWEIKSLRTNQATIAEAYAGPSDGRIMLFNMNIPSYKQGTSFEEQDLKRPRELLLHKKEIAKLLMAVEKKRMTLIPLSLYYNPRGIVKVKLALGKGKNKGDKRQTEKERDWKRDQARILRERN